VVDRTLPDDETNELTDQERRLGDMLTHAQHRRNVGEGRLGVAPVGRLPCVELHGRRQATHGAEIVQKYPVQRVSR
jgi:hypothetical protein